MTFRLAIAPGQVDGVTDGIDIAAKNSGKTGQENEARMNGIINPIVEPCRISALKYAAKPHGEAAQSRKGI